MEGNSGRSSNRFELHEIVEAMDKNDCSQYRYAEITWKVGDRVHVKYAGVDHDDQGFWFNEKSHLIHKVGWCQAIGAKLAKGYIKNLPWSLPDPSEFLPNPTNIKAEVKMVFEMRHPVLVHKITAGAVIKTYKNGYFLAETDPTKPVEVVHFVTHVTSDFILPMNFCKDHGIDWKPPTFAEKGKTFTWSKWLRYFPDLRPLEVDALVEEKAKRNKFKVGDELEVVVLIDPQKIRRASVVQVAGHLIRVKIKSRQGDKAYQWMSCESPNIYPVGNAPPR